MNTAAVHTLGSEVQEVEEAHQAAADVLANLLPDLVAELKATLQHDLKEVLQSRVSNDGEEERYKKIAMRFDHGGYVSVHEATIYLRVSSRAINEKIEDKTLPVRKRNGGLHGTKTLSTKLLLRIFGTPHQVRKRT